MCIDIKKKFLPLPQGIHIEHSLETTDHNYVLYSNSIGVQYVFEKKINHDSLMNALTKLLKEYPALAGRADFKKMKVIRKGKGIPFTMVNNHPDNIDMYRKAGCIQRNRAEFVSEPKRILIEKGKAPLMCIKLTNFASGGCILGITINHALLDAKGFHLVVHRWSRIFTEIAANRSYQNDLNNKLIYGRRSLFTFGSNRGKKKLFQDMRSCGIPKPVNFKGFFGRILKNFMLKVLDNAKRADRELIYFSKEQVARIKETVTKESGEDWITTNEALSAHILKIMSELQYGDKKLDKIQILSGIDIRGRIHHETVDQQARFAGNAFYVYSVTAELGKDFHRANRGEIAAFLKRSFAEITAENLQTDLDAVYDCLRLGYNYPGVDFRIPVHQLNNQSKLPVYDVDFGAGKPLRVIPQDIGDNILFFPARDGGIEVYLQDPMNTERQKKLLTPQWQSEFYDF